MDARPCPGSDPRTTRRCLPPAHRREATTAPTRQRTLRAALDWSYELLSEPERLLFERLSVFAGSWTFEAAASMRRHRHPRAFTGHPGPAGRQVARGCGNAAGDAYRFRLLEPVRQYSIQRLRAGTGVEIQATSFEYFLGLREQLESTFHTGSALVSGLFRSDADRDNLRAAFNWSVGTGRARRQRTLRLVVVDQTQRVLLFEYWDPQPADPQEATGVHKFWATPGGAIGQDENVDAAAGRKLRQETGIRVAELGPCAWKRARTIFIARSPNDPR